MRFKLKYFIACLFCGLCIFFSIAFPWKKSQASPLSQSEAYRIGMQIWLNECSGKKEKLTSWNEGEEFASLGLGHFIWYPSNQSGDFKETFPELVNFIDKQGAPIPAWIKNAVGCPWPSRLVFQQAQASPEMHELREWLFATFDFQIQFIVNRLHRALPTILKHVSPKKHMHITKQFQRLSQSPAGLYALIDYLNFKGEGIAKSESYHGYGWGLLQVLNRMKGSHSGPEVLQEFVDSAKYVLNRRIENAPPERKEERWRQGWYNRLNTYLIY